jgi:hypothetical protein
LRPSQKIVYIDNIILDMLLWNGYYQGNVVRRSGRRTGGARAGQARLCER